HMLGDPELQALPARLRMQRLAAPATSKTTFELASLAASAIGGCEFCLQAHGHVVRAAGLTREHVHEALRIAAIVNGLAIALGTRETPVAAAR
ncbi:MAG: alkyl hydroperoxide reductase, partial [Planctomycetota bacterium]